MMGGDPGRLNYSNVSMIDIIAQAYQVKDYQISGPDWLGSQRFDIVAKLPPDTPKKQIPLMLQSLLAERFKLTIHREKKDLPGYALVVGKNGPKLKESQVDPASPVDEAPPAADGGAVVGGGGRGLGGGGGLGGGRGAARNGMPPMPAGGSFMMMRGRGHIDAKKQDLSSIANMLARQLDRPVVDQTGLKGTYDYSLDWTPDGSEGGERFGPGGRSGEGVGAGAPPTGGGGRGLTVGAPDGNSGPPLLTAIQEQLGLRLERRKVPLDLIVIDHVEKTPIDN
jgi:uncharacterized protein (TIGR03435 family)